MKRNWLIIIMICSAGLFSGGCSNILYGEFLCNRGSQKILLNVASVQIVDDTGSAVEVSSDISGVSPKSRLLYWIRSKFAAVGTEGKLVIAIRDAYIKNYIALESGTLGVSKLEDLPKTQYDSDVYECYYAVTITVEGVPSPLKLAISVRNSDAMQGAFTLAEKRIRWTKQIEDLLRLLEGETNSKVRKDLEPIVAYAEKKHMWCCD